MPEVSISTRSPPVPPCDPPAAKALALVSRITPKPPAAGKSSKKPAGFKEEEEEEEEEESVWDVLAGWWR
jgi:ribosomal protein L12E/L44/L45/RPP1/RPP2